MRIAVAPPALAEAARVLAATAAGVEVGPVLLAAGVPAALPGLPVGAAADLARTDAALVGDWRDRTLDLATRLTLAGERYARLDGGSP